MSNDSTIFERLIDQKLACLLMSTLPTLLIVGMAIHTGSIRNSFNSFTSFYIFTSLKITTKALDMFPMIPSRHDPGAVLVCQLQLQRHRPEQPQEGQVHRDRSPHSSGKYKTYYFLAKGHLLLTHSLQLLLAIHVFNSVSYFLREQDHPFILYQVELQMRVCEDFTIMERLNVKLICT